MEAHGDKSGVRTEAEWEVDLFLLTSDDDVDDSRDETDGEEDGIFAPLCRA